MNKLNTLEVFNFLKSHLISESKTENGKSIFNIKDAAKYCFDKFKNNSFEKTEISLEELDKIGIKNSKYPIEISFVDKEYNSLSAYTLKSGNPYIKISDKNNIPKFLGTNDLYQLLFDILYKLYYNYGINSLIELSSVEDKIFFQKYQKKFKDSKDKEFESMYKESFSTVSFMNYLYYISGGKLKVPGTGLTKFKNLFNMHKEHNIKNMQDEEI